MKMMRVDKSENRGRVLQAVIDLYLARKQVVGLTLVARRAGLSRPTTLAHLKALTERGALTATYVPYREHITATRWQLSEQAKSMRQMELHECVL